MSTTIRNPYGVPGEYRKVQLHCHTTESDGHFRPRELLQMYRDAGYSFVCITDHNRVTRCDELNSPDFIAIPGTEDTVSRFLPFLGPHMGRLFVDAPLRQGAPQERIDSTAAGGGIVALCHPSWHGNLWTGSWSREAIESLNGYHLLEILNPHSDSAKDIRCWEVALHRRGPQTPVWGVAVDDCHSKKQFNKGWIMAKVKEVSASGLRQALLRGAFYATTGLSADFIATGAAVEVRLSAVGRIQFLDAGGNARLEVTADYAQYAVGGEEGYIRVECVAGIGRVWSQPFWVTEVR